MPQGAPGRPRDAQERAPGEPQRSSSRGCLREAKKAQGAPAARNGQFAKEKVLEKQHFGDRLPKLGFQGPDVAPEPQGAPGRPGEPQESPSGGRLQEPKKAQGAPAARNGQFAKEKV